MDERKHSDQEQIIKHNCNEKKESSRGRIINDSPSPFPVMLIHREKREDGRRDAIPSQHRFLRDSVNSVNKARAKKKYDFPEGNHNSLPAGSSYNTSNGVVVLIGVKKREGEGGGSLEKLREGKERPCPKRSDEIG